LRPQLWFVPDGDWFCPNCEHNSLIKKLVFAYGAFLDDTHDRKENEKRKAAAEDRLKREMDFIGISIGPGKKGNLAKFEIKSSSSSSVDSDEEGGQRRSKKKAMKKVMEKTRKQQKREAAELYYPTITVTEGRTRRNVTKVDYNFHTFDEQIDVSQNIALIELYLLITF
jgi:remodeling and spacing factor 1